MHPPPGAGSRRLPFPPLVFPEALPVSSRREEIAHAVAHHPVVIVSGETGSGKTTQLPKICAMVGRGQAGLIGHTQPRRLAATSVAKRIAEEIGTPLGEHVGYKIRFNDRTSPRSSIKLMTDGILLAESLSDPTLSAYDTVIVDEAHERSLNIDFLLGYLKRLLDGPRRDDLKVIITSATIDAERFARHFGRQEGDTLVPAPVIEVSGRMYPVEVRWRPLTAPRAAPEDGEEDAETDEIERDLPTAISEAVQECWQERPGDVLVFLPGEREIRDAQAQLQKDMAAGRFRGPQVEILPLFSRLSAADQDKVFSPGNGRRVVLATNVAETSLTVPGIRYVIDSGLARVKRYRPRSRVEQLQVEGISRAAAAQRAGRCGRVAEGVCIRLYDEDWFGKRPAFTDPEILRSSLAGVILRMKALRLPDIDAFPFVDSPPKRAIADGHALLVELGAIEEDRHDALTSVGRLLAKLPLDPRIGRMLLAARERRVLPEVLVIAAALSVQDPRERPMEAQTAADQSHARFSDERSDFMAYLKLWRHWKKLGEDLSNRGREHELKRQFLSPRRLREWAEVHGQLRGAMEELGGGSQADTGFDWVDAPKPDEAKFTALHQSLLTGLLGSVGMRAPDEPHWLGTHQVKFFLHPSSGVAKKGGRWVMAGELVETTRLFARNVARIDPDWIEKLGGHLLRKSWSEPHWEKRAGQVVAFERATLYGLTLYAQRRVHFADKDPRTARELLIRHALVQGDWEAKLPFLLHNAKLVNEIHALEHRARRPDLMVDDELLYAFHDARVPEWVTSGQKLEAWWRAESKNDPRLLYLSREELLRRDTAGVDDERFPKRLTMRGIEFALSYLFQPGEPDDGVTLRVPLMALNQVDAARCEWLVPGMLSDKVAQLVKSLPQKVRHRCQPVAEFVQAFCERHDPARLTAGQPVRPLLDVLADAVRERTQIPTLATGFRPEALPPHLFMRFSVVDAHGREVAASRNLAQLRQAHGDRAQAQFRDAMQSALAGVVVPAAPAATPRSPSLPAGPARPAAAPAPAAADAALRYTEWAFGALPEIMELKRGRETLVGFPAVVDVGDAVELQVFDEAEVAARRHRAGLRRLFALALKEPLKFLERNLPDFTRMGLAFAPFGGPDELKRQIVEGTVERACLVEPLPVDAAAFAARVAESRNRVGLVGQELARTVGGILAEHAALVKKLPQAARVDAAAQTDIEQQLKDLLAGRWIVDTDVNRLPHFLRYLKAASVRIDKLKADPARDRQKMQELSPLLQNWRRAQVLRKGRPDARLDEFRWLLEELRVSLFAQELRTPMPVSAKRLQKSWESIRT